MIVCLAGKNNIAVQVCALMIQEIKMETLDITLVGLPSKSDCPTDDWQRSYVKFLLAHNIPIVKLEDLYQYTDLVFISLEYDRIIAPQKFQSSCLYNIHFSKLPKYRGMFTAIMPLINGDVEAGVTLHSIDAGIDTGDIIAQEVFPILDTDTSQDLYMKFTEYGTKLVRDNLYRLLSGAPVTGTPQNWRLASYHSKKHIDYGNITIDLQQCAVKIRDQLRAFHFRKFQMPHVFGQEIFDAEVTNHRSEKPAGTLIMQNQYSFTVSTIDYDIRLNVDRFAELLEYCSNGNITHIKEICTNRKYLYERDSHGWTPLMVATYNNKIDAVRFLIELGADIFAVNNHGTTMLMYSKDAFLMNKDRTLYDLFQHYGLSASQTDYNGKSLLDYLDDNTKRSLLFEP